MVAARTIRDHLKLVAPSTARRKTPLPWPPDVFALVSTLLLESGGYVALVVDGFLSPAKRWWEHTKIEPRKLAFFSLNDWLTFSVLICEDLARQDPVARVVRTVGPNLVIALLMDGPQLKARWPARYATVLAEDPGSSVLTITSVGMAERSRPPGTMVSRAVALWKDAQSVTREIELPAGSGSLLLTLIPHWAREWAADGRSNFRDASFPVLAGVHCLSSPDL